MATVVAVMLLARTSLADHYVVPSGSMEPTIHVGDRILVDKRAFGVRLPVVDTYVLPTTEPKSGDVVVLASPESDTTLLKRVVAGPEAGVDRSHAGERPLRNGIDEHLDAPLDSRPDDRHRVAGGVSGQVQDPLLRIQRDADGQQGPVLKALEIGQVVHICASVFQLEMWE